MPLSDIINISISVSGAGPQQAGFGEPLIASYHTHYTDRVREYSSLAGMVADGFLVTDPAYLAAAEVFAQTPAPPAVKIGRRALPYTQVTTMNCLSTASTDTYVFQLRTPGGNWQKISVPSTGVPATDVATINTAVTALGISGLTATHATTILTLTMAVGKLLDVQPDFVHTTFTDTTADPGIATDMAAIIAADNNWYCLLLDNQGSAEVQAAAAWALSNSKLFVYNNSDTNCANPASTTDVMYLLSQAANARAGGLFSQTQLLSYSAAAWAGRLLPTTPGSENWAFKTLAGVLADTLTDTQVHAVENKNASVYTTLAGLNLTQFGKVGDGEFLDIIRGKDALTNALQVAVLGLQANSLKIPFTDAGIDVYRNAFLGVLQQFVNTGFLSSTPAPFVSLPNVASLSSTNKAQRNLPLCSFTATMAGAINSATLNGVLSS